MKRTIVSIISGILTSAVIVCAPTGAAGVYPVYPTLNPENSDEAAILKRGEYIAKIGDCISCHSVTPNGKSYAGGLPIKTPFGTFYSQNITPDKEYGLGNWTFEDFKRAMKEGKSPSGSNYFPVFPYLYYNKISDEDLRSLWAYLQKIPAVHEKNREHDVSFPFSWRFLQYGWKIFNFYSYDEPIKYEPEQSPEWNRGRYLVDGLGHCGMCHTPMNFMGGPKRQYYLTGNFVDGFWASNITGAGLEQGEQYEVSDVFKKSDLLNNAGTVVGPMAEVVHNSLGFLSDEDQQSIANYLKTVQSKQPLGLEPLHEQPTLARGSVVYYRACVVCHQNGETGAPKLGDGDNWFTRAKKGKNILYQNAAYGYNLMPIKGACVTCSYEDIEAATDYMLAKSLTHAQELQLEHGASEKVRLSGEEIYNRSCGLCHTDGKLGAPKLGDTPTWTKLIDKNMDALIVETLADPHGGTLQLTCRHCDTTDIKAAVKYMLQQAKVPGDYSLW
jgi:cytochrome c5